ncbi:hypothetical protein PG996_007870 [Apiospora saccharicola]|uniref:4Fe-4S ferredoxin-type domain-containing protein n=1 Tax=Apiospora saccharicola TaxID=335842 RepID=A0ABR1UWA7_9PEZI
MCKITVTRYRRCDCFFAVSRICTGKCVGNCPWTIENTTYLRDEGESVCDENHRLFNDVPQKEEEAGQQQDPPPVRRPVFPPSPK